MCFRGNRDLPPRFFRMERAFELRGPSQPPMFWFLGGPIQPPLNLWDFAPEEEPFRGIFHLYFLFFSNPPQSPLPTRQVGLFAVFC